MDKEIFENEPSSSAPKKNWIKKIFPKYGGIAFGLFFLGMWYLSLGISKEAGWAFIMQLFFLMTAIELFIYPFKAWFYKFWFTKILYISFQLVFGFLFMGLRIFVLFGKFFMALFLVVGGFTFLFAKALEFFQVPNPLDVSSFISMTGSALLFSFMGNKIVDWFDKLTDSSDSEWRANDREILGKVLGPPQIRFLIYSLYFVMIILFTLAYLIDKSESENFIFITLQSFAAFVAFDTAYEKRDQIRPWFQIVDGAPGFLRNLFQDVIKDLEDSESGNK